MTDAAPPPAAEDPALPPELFTAILRRLVVFLLVVAAGSIGIGLLLGGQRGLWGALIGTGLAAVFAVTTVVAVRAAAKRPMDLLVIAVMGSWLLKTVLVILVLLAVRDADFYHRGVLFGSAAIAVLGSVLIDSQMVMTARIPYAAPAAGGGTAPAGRDGAAPGAGADGRAPSDAGETGADAAGPGSGEPA